MSSTGLGPASVPPRDSGSSMVMVCSRSLAVERKPSPSREELVNVALADCGFSRNAFWVAVMISFSS